MKVQKLIDKLSKLPPDAIIHFDGYDDDEAEELIDELIEDNTEPEINVKQDWKLLPLKEGEAQEKLYQEVMITDLNNPCCKCQFFDFDETESPVCRKEIPPYYRGGYRIRNSEQDSCNSFSRKM